MTNARLNYVKFGALLIMKPKKPGTLSKRGSSLLTFSQGEEKWRTKLRTGTFIALSRIIHTHIVHCFTIAAMRPYAENSGPRYSIPHPTFLHLPALQHLDPTSAMRTSNLATSFYKTAFRWLVFVPKSTFPPKNLRRL